MLNNCCSHWLELTKKSSFSNFKDRFKLNIILGDSPLYARISRVEFAYCSFCFALILWPKQISKYHSKNCERIQAKDTLKSKFITESLDYPFQNLLILFKSILRWWDDVKLVMSFRIWQCTFYLSMSANLYTFHSSFNAIRKFKSDCQKIDDRLQRKWIEQLLFVYLFCTTDFSQIRKTFINESATYYSLELKYVSLPCALVSSFDNIFLVLFFGYIQLSFLYKFIDEIVAR